MSDGRGSGCCESEDAPNPGAGSQGRLSGHLKLELLKAEFTRQRGGTRGRGVYPLRDWQRGAGETAAAWGH